MGKSENAFSFRRPPHVDITAEAWRRAVHQWQFWACIAFSIMVTVFFLGPFGGGGGISILLVFFLPGAVAAGYAEMIKADLRKRFWETFAEINGWEYQESGDPEQEGGIMFRQGRNNVISNEIRGIVGNRPFRILGYSFKTGHRKSTKMHFYTVFGFTFKGTFPHLFLDNHEDNTYNIGGWFSFRQALSLPEEFTKRFKLYAPDQYEIEALQIFTPDVLEYFLDLKYPHDMEFVNQEVLIFVDRQIDMFSELENEFTIALEIKSMLEKKLDRIMFTPIGDKPHVL